MRDIYLFPAIFAYEKPGLISITFPDFPGCTSVAESDAEAMHCAHEALGGHLCVMEDFNDPIPEPSSLLDIELELSERSALIEVFMPQFRDAYDNKAISRTLTLPRWMAQRADAKGIKLSAVIQRALRQEFGLEPRDTQC